MKKSTKKGFTLVELVIVIAVIAILAAVLIPTFSNVVEKANQSADLQALTAELESKYVDYVADNHEVPAGVKVVNDKVVFVDSSDAAKLSSVVVAGKNGYAFTVCMVEGTYAVLESGEKLSKVEVYSVTIGTIAEDNTLDVKVPVDSETLATLTYGGQVVDGTKLQLVKTGTGTIQANAAAATSPYEVKANVEFTVVAP